MSRSLKPNYVKDHLRLQYYDSIYIENRIDNDCTKTYIYIFMKNSKLFYNFLYHYDRDNFLIDCFKNIKYLVIEDAIKCYVFHRMLIKILKHQVYPLGSDFFCFFFGCIKFFIYFLSA